LSVPDSDSSGIRSSPLLRRTKQ